jgi:hypothetical protein
MIDEGFSTEPAHGWMDQALCASVDPDLWFGTKKHPDRARKAAAVCRRCASLEECRSYALADTSLTSGTFGGLTAQERRNLRRDQP